MSSGVYKILNETNGDCYIGSSVNIQERFKRHKKDLKGNRHHSIILQRAYDKYGKDSFTFNVIEECEREDLCDRENHYLDSLTPKYNICPKAYSQVGKVMSEETKDKLRAYAKEHNIRPPACTYESKRLPVDKLDYNTLELVDTFISISDACKSVGKDASFTSTIGSCCKGKRKSAFGFKWRYHEVKEIEGENKSDNRVIKK